jgi:hypothetical protein
LAQYDRADSGLLSGTAIAAAPFTVPAGERWVVHAIAVRYITSATVGNRAVSWRLRDAADVVLLATMTGAVQTASQQINHFYLAGITRDAAASGGILGFASSQQPLPAPLVVNAGEDLQVLDSSNIDGAGDSVRVQILFQRVKR